MATKLDRIRALCAANPNDPFVWYSLAMEERKSDPRAALTTFEKVRREHPGYVPCYYQLGSALLELGERERAAEVLRAGLAVARAAGDEHAAGEIAASLAAI